MFSSWLDRTSPDEHSFGSTPEIPSLVHVVQAEHLVTILKKVQDDIVVFKIPWFSIDGPGDQGKLDLLQEFSFDTSPLTDPLFGVLQGLTRFEHEFERNAVRLACFLVKVETIDESVIIGSIDFFIGDFLCIKRRELIDTNNIEVFNQFFVDLATMNFKYANISCRLFIKVDLFRNAVYQISNNAVLCYENLKGFLFIVKEGYCFNRT